MDNVITKICPKSTLLENNPSLSKRLNSLLLQKEKEFQQNLIVENPFSEKWQELQDAERRLMCGQTGSKELHKDMDEFNLFMTDSKLPNTKDFWKDETSSSKGDNNEKVVHRLLLSEWQKNLQEIEHKWEEEKKAQWTKELQKKVEQWLQQVQKASKLLEKLGLDPIDFLDSSDDILDPENLELLEKTLDVLENDHGVQKLCDLIGRLCEADKKSQINSAQRMTEETQKSFCPHSKEEIIGLRQSNMIQHATPSELALLSDDEMSILFDLKFLESQLLCFDMAGIQEVKVKKNAPDEEQGKGPIILCIDTSGSMYGSPEEVAKAVSLFIAKQAIQDKRACYLINFSTQIETLELAGEEKLSALIKFLQMSFNGYTDVEPAIQHGVEIMKADAYKDSDMLVISDFLINQIDDELIADMANMRSHGNCFYSLCIGEYFSNHSNREYFDREWVYNPESSQVEELFKPIKSATTSQT